MESVQVEVKIELGHKASCKRTPSPEGFTHDWIVFVRSPESCDISHFVEKVVFQLHESFAKPRRVLKEPPYRVAEAGYGSFYLPIEVYFKNKEEPRKLKFDYDLFLPVMGSPPIDNIRSEALTFKNPTEEFKKKLVKGGGIVTSLGTVNGLHGSSSPGNGTTHPQSTETHAGKATNNINDIHHTPRQHSTPVQEPDKNKRHKHDGMVGNKSVKTQEAVTPGIKRSSSTSGLEELQTQPTVKKKKKKTDEGTSKPSKPVGFIPLELLKPGNEHKDKLEEVKDVKLKIKSLPSNSSGSDKKKNRQASSEVGTGDNVNNSLKRKDSTSSKKAKLKSSKEDLKQTKPDDKKVEKITFRRGSGDSWSSSTSSSSLLGNTSGNKNTALNALLAEIGDDDDDDEDEVDIFTPFQPSSIHTATTQKQKGIAVTSPNSLSQSKDSSKVTAKSSSQTKKSETVKNGRKNGLKSPTTKSPSKQSQKPKLKDSRQGSNGQQNELVQLHKRLVTLKDSSVLQRVADILEATGCFELTETTLDFDLCALDKTTIKKIENSINR